MEWPEMPEAQVWRANYRKNRYLEHKSVTHIASRMRDLAECILQLSSEGKIIPETKGPLASWLLERITHTIHEFELRKVQFPDGFMSGARVPRTTSREIAPEQECYNLRNRTELGEVFRFGKQEWLNRSLNYGEFRMCAASKYKSPELNDAIRDDELSLTAYPKYPGDLNQTKNILAMPSLMSDGGVKLSAISDYYILSFSTEYSLRMFADFEADSCLIIYDAKEFGRRIIGKIKEVLPGWMVGSLPVTYVDPDDLGDKTLLVPQVKLMKYAYQMEERIIAHSPKPHMICEPRLITIGALRDIAEVITLRQES
jgi:hypothetical protein